MRFHWTNENERRRLFWHGRAWLYLDSKSHDRVRFEWLHGDASCRLTLETSSGEGEVTFSIALPLLFSYFLTVSIPYRWFDRLGKSYSDRDRTIGLSFHNWSLWWDVWARSGEWRSTDPWWQRGSLDMLDLVFGKSAYRSELLSEHEIRIPLLERSYPATVKLERCSWVRPRWPWRPLSFERTTSTVDIPEGIPVPGKGENSWDCGPDALYGQSSDADTVEAAIGKVVQSVLRTRKRYAGRHDYDEREERRA